MDQDFIFPELEEIARATASTGGATPSCVIEAFLPTTKTVFETLLRPVTIGTWMVMEKIKHPFVTPNIETSPYDIACAFYILTTDTPTVFGALKDGGFELAVLSLMDSLPLRELQSSLTVMQEHFTSALDTAVAMTSPHDNGQKKTEASGGY